LTAAISAWYKRLTMASLSQSPKARWFHEILAEKISCSGISTALLSGTCTAFGMNVAFLLSIQSEASSLKASHYIHKRDFERRTTFRFAW
jgi:hypothetical protein